MASIFETLESLGVASKDHQEVFSEGTRDRKDVTVFRDRQSGVIYIDGFYGGDEVYEDGSYRDTNAKVIGTRDFEVQRDAERRVAAYRQFVVGKHILEFGCGDGAFLHAVNGQTASSCGVELQNDYIEALNAAGIACYDSLSAIGDKTIDSVLSFHVLEHVPDPIPVMQDLKRVLKPGGYLVVEVPHANDFLLSHTRSEAFKAFTLWSQHLVLHTRDSLKRLLEAAGFEDVIIEGVQRYPLSNHLTWLSEGKPGGHKSGLSALDTEELTHAYASALAKIDATDTIVAIARYSG